jgi:N-acetylated-alpha-linked acidic dipeptidase
MKKGFFMIFCLFSSYITFGQFNPVLNEMEKLFLEKQDKSRFKTHLYKLTDLPHITASKNNEKVRDYIVSVMDKAGLKVEVFPYDIYLPVMPGNTAAELVTPIRIPLNNKENIHKEDRFSGHPDLTQGFNAYSGSGDVTGEVIYVNYGRKEDFEQLAAMGISVKGKIVLARYGGNFRGYKAKFAEQYGAIGLLIFTDPGDSGYMKGLVYPEGPYYDEASIQRGSLLTLPYSGDPLTPMKPALPIDGSKKIDRLKPADIKELHNIPVMPLPYGSAKEIIARMKGKPVPAGWQGGLPYTYRIEGGSELTVRVNVQQEHKIQRVYNIIGTLEGTESPNEWVIAGCHYDAWNFGSIDPNSGTAMLLAVAETFGKMAKEGKKPKRTIKIAHWDAEEVGIIGATEWVEHFRDDLNANTIAYLNADAAVGGKNFGGGASPTLKDVMITTTSKVQYPDSSKSVLEQWKGSAKEPAIGNLGGGSDHLPFYTHVGIPSWSGGTGGVSIYHSIYDNLHFYETFTDPDFKFGPMVEQVFGFALMDLAGNNLIPYGLHRYGVDSKKHFEDLQKAFDKLLTDTKSTFNFSKLIIASDKLTEAGNKCAMALQKANPKNLNEINQRLLKLERFWIDGDGMSYGSWHKSMYASSDPYSGYASWMMPAFHYELSLKNTSNLVNWEGKYLNAINNLTNELNQIQKLALKK